MKKLTSLFLGCMMITCAFTSCGDKDESDSEKSSKKDSNPIVGSWDSSDISGSAGRYTFSDNGKLTMSMEWTDYLCMDGNKCLVGGTDVTDYLEFDGSVFTLSEGGTEIINMKKVEKGDDDDFDGEYDINGGYLADVIDSQFGEGEFNISITFDGDVTYFNVKDVADYKIDGDKLTLENMPESMSDEESEELTFEIDGDKLTLSDEDDTIEFTRVK